MADIIDFPKKISNQIDIKCWMLNNDIAEQLSRYEEEVQFVAVIGVLKVMIDKNPSLREALLNYFKEEPHDKS